MIRYVDTSAALKLVEEAESPVLASDLTRSAARGDRLVASWPPHAEMRSAAQRRSAIDPADVQAVLDGLTVIDVERADLARGQLDVATVQCRRDPPGDGLASGG